MVDRVRDRVALDRRRPGAAEAEVDDPRAVVDRVHDPGRLVHVRERAVAGTRLDHEQLRVAAEAGDPVAVRHRPGRDRGDERAVAVVVAHVGGAGAGVVRGGRLRREVGRGQVGARVDHGDADGRGGAEDRVGHAVLVRAVVLPLQPGRARRREPRARARRPRRARPGGETKRIPGARRSRAAGSSVRTSAARSAGRRRTTTAPVPCSAAARSACVR